MDQLNTNTVSQFSNLKSFKEALTKKKLQEKFYKSTNLNSSKSSARGGSVTDRSMRGTLMSKKPAFRSTKNSEAGLGSSAFDQRLQSKLLKTNCNAFGTIGDSDQLLMMETANNMTTSHSHHPYYIKGRNRPSEAFAHANRANLLQEGFNTVKYTTRNSDD